MRLNIEHRTAYQYSESVNYTIQQLRLTPQDIFGQRVIKWDIRVNGHLQQFSDTYGNIVHTLVIDKTHDQINILAIGEVETECQTVAGDEDLPIEIYLRETPLTIANPALKDFTLRYLEASKTLEPMWLDSLMNDIVDAVPYVKGITDVKSSAAEAFEKKAGVCQDHAHIFITCCRLLGLPARYVSGYLFTQDGSLMESHGWADVWLNGLGWHSYDVSNRCHTSGVHVRLASGLDYHDACPVSGMRMGGGLENMQVSVLVNQHGQMQQAQQ